MKKVFLISLGCSKNLVDSEHILGLLKDNGYEVVLSESQADIVVINTCGFISDSKKESINKILNNIKAMRQIKSCRTFDKFIHIFFYT